MGAINLTFNDDDDDDEIRRAMAMYRVMLEHIQKMNIHRCECVSGCARARYSLQVVVDRLSQ